MKEYLEIKEYLKNADHLLICANPDDGSIDLQMAVSALFFTLTKTGRVVKLYPKDLLSKKNLYPFLLPNLKPIVFSLEESSFLKGVYYKKEKKSLEICLLAKNEAGLNLKEVVKIKRHSPEPNLIITLGISSLETLEDFYEANFKLFFSLPIINIDNQEKNTEFGKINLIEKKPFSCLITKILYSLSKNFDKYTASSLLLGIFSAQKNKTIEAEVLEIVAFLKRKISNFAPISANFFETSKKRNLFELFLKNLEYLKNKKLTLVSVKNQDFVNYQLSENDLPEGIELFRGKPWIFSSLLVLWESFASPKYTKGVFYTPEEKYLQKTVQLFKGETRPQMVFFLAQKTIEETKFSLLNSL